MTQHTNNTHRKVHYVRLLHKKIPEWDLGWRLYDEKVMSVKEV